MSKIRIYELAKQLGVANKDLVAKINSIGIEAKATWQCRQRKKPQR